MHSNTKGYWRCGTTTKEDRSDRHRRFKFGVTREQYELMRTEQDGHCAACPAIVGDASGRDLALDHDHSTGAVRGLLCNADNRILGLVGDDPERLEALAAYLRKHLTTVKT